MRTVRRYGGFILSIDSVSTPSHYEDGKTIFVKLITLNIILFQPRPTMRTVRQEYAARTPLIFTVSTPSHYEDGKTFSGRTSVCPAAAFQPRPTMGTVRLKKRGSQQRTLKFQPRPTMGTVRQVVVMIKIKRVDVSTPSHYGDGKTVVDIFDIQTGKGFNPVPLWGR